MWIERILLKRFLVFEDDEVRFGPGLNVVLSPNEGGKSSLMKGIITALYRDASSRKKEVMALRRWGSDRLFELEMEFYLKGQKLKVVRDFEEKRQALFREGEVDPFLRGRGVDEYLRGCLPLPDENLFSRVCGVRQERLVVSNGRLALGERLEEIMGGGWGEATPAEVKRMLEGSSNALLRGMDHPANPENWGPIKRLTHEIDSLEGELSEAENAAKSREELLREVSTARKSLGSVKETQDMLEQKRQSALEYDKLRKEEEESREQADQLRKRRERVEMLITERNRLLRVGEEFPTALTGSDEAECDGYRVALEDERRLTERYPPAESITEGPLWMWKVVVSSLLVLVGILMTVFVGRVYLVFSAAGLLLGAWFIFRRMFKGLGAAAVERERELRRLGGVRRSWAGDCSLEESMTLIKGFGDWKREFANIGIRLEEAAGGLKVSDGYAKLLADLEEGYSEKAIEWHALSKKRELLEPFRLDSDGLLKLEREIGKCQSESSDLEGRISSLELELASHGAPDMSGLKELLASRRAELERVRRKALIVEIAIKALEEARRMTAGSLAERLPPLAGGFLSTITSGRYGEISFDPMNLEAETVPHMSDISCHGDGGTAPERITPDVLSQGARDQLYLAIRLALVELLSVHDFQPLFLDDSFVHFDPERKKRAIELVLKAAEHHQVVLLTCDPGHADIGGRVVNLELGSN